MLGHVSPTAGRLSGEMAQGGGIRIEITCGLEIAEMEIVLNYSQTQALYILEIYKIAVGYTHR